MKKFVKNVASNIGGCLLRKGKQIVRNSRALVTVVMALARMKKLPNPLRADLRFAAKILHRRSLLTSSSSFPPLAQRRESGASGSQGRMIRRFCSG